MKITQKWKRNMPSTLSGESITVTINYSSFKKEEIDELEKHMPSGIIISETNGNQVTEALNYNGSSK